MWLIDKIDEFLKIKKVKDPIGRKKMKGNYFCKNCFVNEFWFEEIAGVGVNVCPICDKGIVIKFENMHNDDKDLAVAKYKEMWKALYKKYPW